MKKPKNREGVVYSTNPSFEYNDWAQPEPELLPWSSQRLKVSLDKSGRGGKVVTLVDGFQGPATELERLARELKSYCGTGGSAKEGQVLIQGDVRNKVVDFLVKKGTSTKVIR